ncbi:Small ribosomal subunit protein [Trichinella spiralis]|uniref:Small ribosomal subunit protein n=1 Tax=Trichinella spiralis TaxID=6334 RepID=A0ABR3KG52_TRISP
MQWFKTTCTTCTCSSLRLRIIRTFYSVLTRAKKSLKNKLILIFDHLQSIFKNKRRRRTVYHQGLCGMNLLELVERDCTYCKIRKEMFVWGGLIGNDSVK